MYFSVTIVLNFVVCGSVMCLLAISDCIYTHLCSVCPALAVKANPTAFHEKLGASFFIACS